MAHLHIAAGRLTRFAHAAGEIGSEHWMPIVALAQAAIQRGRREIARDIFAAAAAAAADRSGLQRDHLRQRCIDLTGSPPPTPTS